MPDQDWDNLIVLDACRADLFEEVADFDRFDEYRSIQSRASSTNRGLKRIGRVDYGDTVYVTVHGRVAQTVGENFYKLVEPWRDIETNSGRYPPEILTDAAIESYREDKRLVVHYLQPHHPFIDNPNFDFREKDTDIQFSPWAALREGERSFEEVWDGYKKNLDRVLNALEDLLKEIEGRTVITSDHGNFVGEKIWPIPIRAYGHPPGHRHPSVTQVPWAVINDGKRRKIVSDDSGDSIVASEEIEDQLAALGYKE